MRYPRFCRCYSEDSAGNFFLTFPLHFCQTCAILFPKNGNFRRKNGESVRKSIWIEPAVRPKEDAFSFVQTLFRDGEDCVFRQWLSRFYFFCPLTLLAALAYFSLFIIPFLLPLVWRVPILFWLSWGGIFVVRAFLLRSACANLLVVSQKAVYLYFRCQSERVDRFRWENVRKVRFHPWRFFPSFATVTLYRSGHPFRRFSPFRAYRRKQALRERPETVDFQEFSLTEPYSLRFVVRAHGELYERCRMLQMAEGYFFSLSRKERRRAKRRTSSVRTTE